MRLAELVGPDNVMAGNDCGFAQTAFMQRVHPEVQWAKPRRSPRARGSPATAWACPPSQGETATPREFAPTTFGEPSS